MFLGSWICLVVDLVDLFDSYPTELFILCGKDLWKSSVTTPCPVLGQVQNKMSLLTAGLENKEKIQYWL